jgi:hypothetical protein
MATVVGSRASAEVGAGDGEEEGQVAGGFGDAQAADGGGEDIAVGQAEAGVLFEDGDEHGEAVGVEAGALAFGGAEESGGGEGLDLDEDAACSLHHGADDASGAWGAGRGSMDRGDAGALGGFAQSRCRSSRRCRVPWWCRSGS